MTLEWWYLDDFAFDVADGFGRRPFDEGEKEPLAQLILDLHLQVGIHKQFKTLIIDILIE